MRRSGILVLAAGLLLSGCGGHHGSSGPQPTPGPGPGTTRTPTEKLALKTFAADCSDFLAYAGDALTEQYLTSYYCFADGPCPVYAADNVPPPSATPAPGASPGAGGEAAGPDRVSGTNTQEAGVDEADIVKADAAGRLYILSGRQLHILAAFPPAGLEQRPLVTLDLAAGDATFYASDMLLDETAQTLVALGSTYADGRGQAVALIIDLTDPAAPQQVGRVSVDGWPLQTRRIERRVHRVSRFDVPTPAWFYDGSDSQLTTLRSQYQDARGRGDDAQAAQIKSQINARIRQRVSAAGAAEFLPHRRVQLAGAAPLDQALACDAIAHPDVTAALGLAVIDSFDTDGGNSAASAIVNNAYLVYASTANLYLVQSSFGWWFDPAQAEETAIYRLALSATGAAAYRAVGTVDGTVSNSYQLSEYDGHLRVASTQTRLEADRFEPVNHVTVLDAQSNDTMAQTGALRDLAPGERIQSSRFIGPRGFVVTFRQIDPLFALDLSDPANPAVADELKLPGFSSYILPLGDDYLLTIGREGTDDGTLTGNLAVQLFDVADLTDISQIGATLTPSGSADGYSYSAAEYDPHAFSYFPDSEDAPVPGTLSVPLQRWSESGSFTGFQVVRVDPAAATPLTELALIDHQSLIDDSDPAYDCPPPGSGILAPCYIYAADPRRSVFMADANGRYLFTVSSVGVIASDAAQPATELGRRQLPYDPPCCVYAAAEPGGP
ncbi:beta-propeller domain-containing protein [Fontimonas sp. SYSU GA230001]|uniref:beta-propeller domain-containing protein n=1 Tax=Fontimonas sp. SYSU GA230001 TaxID=3142450 RepID=UPI0032B49ED6